MKRTIKTVDISSDYPPIQALYDDILVVYGSTLRNVIPSSSCRLELGVSLQILKSIIHHLKSLKDLLEACYIESGAAVATSSWEKCLSLQYLLVSDTENKVNKYLKHDTFKSTPWSIKKMVKDVVEHDKVRVRSVEDQSDLLYLQYSYLCAIKHGNPFTLSYLNRKLENQDIFDNNVAISIEDRDIVVLLLTLIISFISDTLQVFAKKFCNTEHLSLLSTFNNCMLNIMNTMQLNIPKIIVGSSKDFRPEFWLYLEEIECQVVRKPVV